MSSNAVPAIAGARLAGAAGAALSDDDTNGYRVGFFCYLEELIAIAAKRTNIFNNVDECNMRSLIAEAELKEEEIA